MSLEGVALRAVLTYLFLWGLLRASGKRGLGEADTLDLVVALILGDMVDDFVWAEVAASQFIVAVGAMMWLHVLLSTLQQRFPRIAHWLEGEPDVIVRNGQLRPHALRRNRLSREELDNELRLAGADSIEQIAIARLETNGRLTFEYVAAAQPLRRRDL